MQKNNRTILLLCPYPKGVAPSQRFRFEQYLGALEQHHFTVDFRPFLTDRAWRMLYTRGRMLQKILSIACGFIRRVALLFRAVPRADFVFIHREASPIGPPVFEFIIAKILRKKIIYDFDDAIWLPNTSEENAMVSRIKWHSKVRSICKWSYRVSAGNAYLASFARQFGNRVIINPTTVDTGVMHPRSLNAVERTGNRVTIGWTGSHSTLKYLQLIEPALVFLEKEFSDSLQFVVIADRPPSLALKNMVFVPWNKESEVEDLSRLDIGIMPLEDDPWSRGKCALKALQYMAIGIPTVASPVGVNALVIEHGINGFLADTQESWTSSLKGLIENPGLRIQLGDAGRKKVVANYSTGSNLPLFLSLFE